jgi:hypothetical protein
MARDCRLDRYHTVPTVVSSKAHLHRTAVLERTKMFWRDRYFQLEIEVSSGWAAVDDVLCVSPCSRNVIAKNTARDWRENKYTSCKQVLLSGTWPVEL